MAARKKEINLLPKEPWEKGILGQLIPWTLSVGRYVVVFVELIVISAFLYRFGLDRQLTDLNEKIKQKQAIVSSYGDLEAKFKQVQGQLEKIKTTDGASVKIDELLDKISQITPIDAAYDSIMINQKEISLQGRVLSEAGLATLLTQAQASKEFSDVSLENVSSGTDNIKAIIFRMSLGFKQK
ncbi:PilN domain-containing protein [Patescibacteria group bacterium]|nr:PilN domain-containing protein [Patescibacteria group bacterium]